MIAYIVDDDINMCNCLKQLIPWGELGFEYPIVCSNGLDAVMQIEGEKPDLVVSDLKMPGMDGKELCINVREHYPDVDFIFLSAYEDFQTMQIALKYGVKCYILKPINKEGIEQIITAIKQCVSQKKQNDWWNTIFSSTMTEKIYDALDKRDNMFFYDFITEIKTHVKNNMEQTRHLTLYLMQLLNEYVYSDAYLKEISVLGRSEQKNLQKIYQLDDVEACINFVKNCYDEVLSLMPENREKKDLIGEIHELVANNYMNPDFGVAWISEEVHLAPAYLSRIYSSYSEVNLVNYIVNYRIKEACKLLQTTTLSISKISLMTGYRNVNYFAKLFRVAKGMSPSEYQRQYHGEL